METIEQFGLTVDLERLNFLSWYQNATQEDIEIARKNNAEKLDELIEKYKCDLEFMEIITGRDTAHRVLMGI
jgi:hypothetical protein